ncbi:MAG: hypothetical protein BGO54_02270 [Sphingobacteriales bacterium 46-32]|nr:MAG: hypothetical protein BGO54_02270 [Sphingobacteriales bacterium 46-32]
MINRNSGQIYVVPLDFKLGYTLCKFSDYTDVAPFDGALVSVLNFRITDLEDIPSVEKLHNFEVLYGPVPLNKLPNTKGKGAWKYIGKVDVSNESIPIFKDTNQIITLSKAIDWSKVGGWRKQYNFHESENVCNYEEVRGLEMRTLYDMRGVGIRATMHFLLLDNKRVEEYYDLSVEKNRRLYLQMINTSFDKKVVAKYNRSVKLG